MKKALFIVLALIAAAAGYALFSSCGGGGSETDSNKLVDPYITGAILFEDVNGDGVQDATEQVSSATDANGSFTFTNPLTTGSIIRLTATKGTHNGVAYVGDIMAKVTDPGAYQIVSPMNTLLANGWTAQNVVDSLTAAGLTGITADDVVKDPMAAFNLTDTLGSITDDKLARIQASIAIYCFLKIIDELIDNNKYIGSGLTNGFTLTYAKFVTHPDQQELLANMISQIKLGLSRSVLETIDTQIQAAKAQCPETEDVTVSDILKGSVAISNYVIEGVVNSCALDSDGDGFPDCSWAPNTAYFNTWSDELGKDFYTIRTSTNTCTQTAVTMGLLDNVLSKTYCKLEGSNDANATVNCY